MSHNCSAKMYAKHVASELSIKDYYANADLYFNKNGELTDFHYDKDQAAVKLVQFQSFCALNNLAAVDCVPVGDSNNDIGLFRKTGNGILVDNKHAGNGLKKAAWRTVNSLSEIRQLLTDSN